MTDVTAQINAVRRSVGTRTFEAGEARVCTISRGYATTVEDLWDACTNPERIPRWFLPVSGELKVGGRYQLEGNAGGVIERCDPPHGFVATWEYNGQTSWIEVKLTAEPDGRARLELAHIARVEDHAEFWERYGPGATGIGWELALLGLFQHLDSGRPVDPEAFQAWNLSEEGMRFMALSGEQWCLADIAAGADEAAARAAAERVLAFYTGREQTD
ncbi:SRPBCC family protein [Thermomonospora catenispora]|uniref:SRPBCC family protein n=1 Tax=Thermomonospora catenispora TaxID=2493090 RepID=UPI001122320E|nr:SRPBCC family protein [Thermomonospora catenispora]TNY35688.1 SRPBCC family protein [Thermomonospora catenispora]